MRDLQGVADEIDGERSRVHLLRVDLGNTGDVDRIWAMVDRTDLSFDNWDLESEFKSMAYAFGIDDDRADAYYAQKIFEHKVDNDAFCDPEIAEICKQQLLVAG